MNLPATLFLSMAVHKGVNKMTFPLVTFAGATKENAVS